jgi:hypothetical protein
MHYLLWLTQKTDLRLLKWKNVVNFVVVNNKTIVIWKKQ